jgi:tripartite-type tricarboxylate transporter receptor subunit TctC
MKRFLLGVGATVLAFASPLAAQDYPAKGRTITMIIPNAAGGGTDVAARLIAPVMEKDLGVPIAIVNRPGAGTQVGTSEALKAKPDGYTLFWSYLPVTPCIYLDPDRKASFNRKDIKLIGNAYGAPFSLVVLANSPYKTVQDLIAAAKARPNQIKSGTTGFMATGYFANMEFQRAAKIEMPMVNFDGGAPQLTAVLGGHIDVGFNSIGELLSYRRAGTIRVLAVMGKTRSAFLPDVPTLEELGIRVETSGSYVGFAAPADVPDKVVDVLTTSLRKATENPFVMERMHAVGNTLMYMDAKKYATFWDDFAEALKPLIKIAKEQNK